jgi:hypothetical protein
MSKGAVVWTLLTVVVKKENGGARADPAIPCSSMNPCDKVTAWQLHRSARQLGTSVARVTKACAHRLRSSGSAICRLATNLANQYTQSCDRTNV